MRKGFGPSKSHPAISALIVIDDLNSTKHESPNHLVYLQKKPYFELREIWEPRELREPREPMEPI